MTHMYFSARAEGRISYGHLGRTNSCCTSFSNKLCAWRQYSPAPPPRGRPSASRAAEQTQRSSTFPRRIRSTLTAAAALRVMAALSKAAWRPSPFDLKSGVRVTCDVGYLCANFGLPRPLYVLDLGPMYSTDRQTYVRCASSFNASTLWGQGHNNIRNSHIHFTTFFR